MNRTAAAVTLALVGLGAGCAPAVYNPFRVPEPEIRSRVKSVAIAPVAIPRDLGLTGGGGATLESLLEAKVREAGFTPVAPQQFRSLWDAKVNELGGLFDARTGERDAAKLNELLEHVRGQLRDRFNADAILFPHVDVVKADFNAHRVRWDGAEDSVVEGGFFEKFTVGNLRGSVPALSLLVEMGDMNNATLYRNAGGIQVLERLATAGERFRGRNFVRVPATELLADEARLRQAVDAALEPLLKR